MQEPISPTRGMTSLWQRSWQVGLGTLRGAIGSRDQLEVQTQRGNSLSEQFRLALLLYLFHPLQGMSFSTWLQLLRKNHFRVDPAYWPRASLLTATSLFNSGVRLLEDAVHGRAIGRTQTQAPVFLLGHFRSGTTFLQRLLSLDPQFASPNFYQAYFPHSFLLTESAMAPILRLFLRRHRLQDSVALSVKTPAEDESALSVMTLLSPYISDVFQRTGEDCTRYATFRGVSEAERNSWKKAFTWYCKKLTYFHNKTLLLKSPPHTGRIELLLEIFPDARFISIHRNPYDVFSSTLHMIKSVELAWRLQHPADIDLTESIIKSYSETYHCYFESRRLIPPGRLYEIGFADLERDPISQIREIYSALDLAGFPQYRDLLLPYLRQTAGHRKATYAKLPEALRRRISHEWSHSFEEWGYPYE